MALGIGETARAMAIWQGVSGLPEDRYVNTFHFRVGPITDGRSPTEEIVDALRAFYNDVQPETNSAVIDFLGGGPMAGEIRIYDLTDPEPREPVIVPMASPAWKARASIDNSLPNEVAAVLSWGTAVIAPKPGAIGPRGRGRTYLGPLATFAKGSGPTGPILKPEARLTFAHAARRVLMRAGASLVVHSEKYNRQDVVTKGFVDNAFDTQRRRGVKATGRVTFLPGSVTVPAAG